MQEVRCTACNRKLAEADFTRLHIKCPRCGTLVILRATSPHPNASERPLKAHI